MSSLRTWRAATEAALYGPGGFYLRGRGPGADYRTAATASPHLAAALLRLAAEIDGSLGHPARFDLVEVGAAGGVLLESLRAQAGSVVPELAGRLHLHGVDLAPRPERLPGEIGWSADIPSLTGLLIAHEWLDNVPVDVVEVGAEGVRLVLVGPDGTESIGPAPTDADLAWLRDWWPLDAAEPGDRAEVGLPRDLAWAAAVRQVTKGVAVAVDYTHVRAERAAGAFVTGTLVGYRGGRLVPAVPDGSCDLTAHVAIDSCAAAARPYATHTALTSQRDALRALGVTGTVPPRELASSDPVGYLAALQGCTEQAELINPDGLGRFRWLSHAIDTHLPPALSSAAALCAAAPCEALVGF